MKVLFLDESGDHNLRRIDTQYPVFVLGGVIADVRYAKDVLEPEVARFKTRQFGRDDIVLHTADIVRNRNGFEGLANADRRRAFFSDLNQLMRRLDYQVVACGIRKIEYRTRYGRTARDPYEQCLNILVERFCYEIGGYGDTGWIVAEGRGPLLDSRLMATWESLCEVGTEFVSGTTIRSRVRGMVYRAKERNIAGLQIADLAVCRSDGIYSASPLGRISRSSSRSCAGSTTTTT